MPNYEPPFTLNNKILSQVAEISEVVGRLSESTPFIEFMLGMILRAVGDLTKASTTQKTTQKMTQNQQAILSYLLEYPRASRVEIAEAISTVTENGVKYNLKVLQNFGLLKRIGSARAGHWKVLQ